MPSGGRSLAATAWQTLQMALTRMIHQLVGWDKETAIWWAGACELTFHFDWMLCWVRSPFPPAHHGLTHAGPTLRESSGLPTVLPPDLSRWRFAFLLPMADSQQDAAEEHGYSEQGERE